MTPTANDAQARRANLLNMPSNGSFGLNQFALVFALVFAIWHVLTNVILNEPGMWQNAIHFAGFAFLASVTVLGRLGRNGAL